MIIDMCNRKVNNGGRNKDKDEIVIDWPGSCVSESITEHEEKYRPPSYLGVPLSETSLVGRATMRT